MPFTQGYCCITGVYNEPDLNVDGNDVNCNTTVSTDCSQSTSEINQSQLSTATFQNAVASDIPSSPQISSQQSGTSIITQFVEVKTKGNTIQNFSATCH